MKIIVVTLGGRGYNENYCSYVTYIRVHVHARNSTLSTLRGRAKAEAVSKTG